VSGILQFVVVGLLEGGLYSLVGATIVLVYKSTQVASLAHGQILAFGALFCYLFYSVLGLPLIVALLLTFAASYGMGFLIERIAMRPLIGQPLFAAFLNTFALFIILDGVLNIVLKGGVADFPDILPSGSLRLSLINIPISQLISFMVALFLFGLLALFFRFTKIGLNMLATAENHHLAQSAGIRVKQVFSMVWGLSALLAAVAGMASANIMDISFFLPNMGIKGLTVALFGGMDSIPGALLGGLILGIFENAAAGYLDPLVGGGVKEVAGYAMMLLILLLRPYGLFGQVRIERI
jgi:branched-chain amino acid transport system permease protein